MADEKNKVLTDEQDEDESDDEDYVPSNDEGDDDDEIDLKAGDKCEDSDDDERKGKRRKIEIEDVAVKSETPKLTAEEEKAKSDALWAELNSSEVKMTTETSLTAVKPEASSPTVNTYKINVTSSTSSLSSDIKILPAAGLSGLALRQASAQRKVAAASRLSAILGKKTQPSTLMKTKEDWEKFKNDTGLAEELREHTKSKNSYVERQAFLQRADLKQFEQEKAVRDRIRARQMN